MQNAVNDVIDIFTSEDIENMHVTGYFLVKHSHLYILYIVYIYFVSSLFLSNFNSYRTS